MVISNVNGEITLLAGLAALAIGDHARAANLLNTGVALQTSDGGVLAIAGPVMTPQGDPLLYPQNQRTVEYGYTALLLAALARRSPLAPLIDLATELPAGVAPPRDAMTTPLPLALLSDPCMSTAAFTGGGDFILSGQARNERWLRWYTAVRHDVPGPAACYAVSYGLSGSGPWTGHQLKIADARGDNHGLTFPTGLGPDAVNRRLNLSWLGLFWPRDLDDTGPPFELGQLELVATGAPDAPPTGMIQMQVTGLQIGPGDCLEGSPGIMVIDRMSLEGADDRLPRLSPVASSGQPGVEVELADTAWQRVVIQDRWQWPCATELVVRYRARSAMELQIVVEDSNSDPAFVTGARWFTDTMVEMSAADAWQEWRIPVESLRRFDEADPRALDWTRIRKLAVAFPRPSSSQRIDLQSIEAGAPADRLDASGVCLGKTASRRR